MSAEVPLTSMGALLAASKKTILGAEPLSTRLVDNMDIPSGHGALTNIDTRISDNFR